MFITDDLGANWTAINNGLGSVGITAVECYDGYVFAGTDADGVYRSDDQGGNWHHRSDGLPEHTSVRCMHVYGDRVFVGTGYGSVFVTADYGDSWTDISYGLVGSPVLSLHVYGDVLYAGLNAGGAWEYPVSDDFVCGDADGSGSVDIDDVVFLVAYIFAGGPAPSPLAAGDADCSGAIDDIVYLIAYIFSGGNAPCDPDGDSIPDC